MLNRYNQIGGQRNSFNLIFCKNNPHIKISRRTSFRKYTPKNIMEAKKEIKFMYNRFETNIKIFNLKIKYFNKFSRFFPM